MVEKLHIWRKYRPEQPSDAVDAVHELTRFGGFTDQQARAISNVLDNRAQFQKNDYREAFLTIERWADRAVGDVELPFIVVANDGSTADFTSIEEAVDSVAAGGRAFIWIKHTDTAYADTGPVAFGTKQITLWGAGPAYLVNSGECIRWNITGSPDISISAAGTLSVHNLFIQQITATTFASGSTAFNLHLEGSAIGQDIGNAYATFMARESDIILSSGAPYFDFVDCEVTFQSGTYSLRHSNVTGCEVVSSGTCTFNCPGTSTGEDFIFNDNRFNGGAFTITGWTQVSFIGNITTAEVVFGPTFSGAITLDFASCRNIQYDSNLWGSTVTFSATGANNRGNIAGTCYQMEIAGSGFSFNVTLEGDRALGAAAATNGLLISGNNNVGVMMGNFYTNILNITGDSNNVAMNGTNVGTNYVNVSGDDNKIVVPGEVLTLGIPAYDGAPAVAFVDTGARNTFV